MSRCLVTTQESNRRYNAYCQGRKKALFREITRYDKQNLKHVTRLIPNIEINNYDESNLNEICNDYDIVNMLADLM